MTPSIAGLATGNVMRWLLILTWLAMTPKVVAQGVLLTTGHSLVFEFSSLNYLRPIAFPNEATQTGSGQLDVNFTTYSVGDGDSFLLEAYADSLSDIPKSRVFTFPENQLPEGIYVGFLWWPGSESFWPDLQGVARLTVLTGSAEITSFGVRQIVGGSVYQQSFPVPEPSCSVLFVLGGVFLLFLLQGGLPTSHRMAYT
jgi:hypothetical protein